MTSKNLVEKEKFQIKQFRDKSSNFWLNNKHYSLKEDNSIFFVCGGKEDEKETEEMLSYIKRNRKSFVKREPSIFENEPKEYSIVNFGKMAGKTTQVIVEEDKRYAKWLYESVSDIKLKTELKELLKIKY